MTNSVDLVVLFDIRFAGFADLFNDTGEIAAYKKIDEQEPPTT